MKTEKINPFTVVSSANDQFKIWIPKPTYTGRCMCTASFPLNLYLQFVDAIDGLSYVQVESVKTVDEGLSYLVLLFEKGTHLCTFIEDLPELMHQYLQGDEAAKKTN